MKQRWQDLAKTRMKEVGMTQEQLAEALGITPLAKCQTRTKPRGYSQDF